MSQYDWNNGSDESDIGKQIEDLVQNAINSVDFSGLSEKIKETVDCAQDAAKQTGDALRKAQYEREQSNIVIDESSSRERGYVPPVQKPRELQNIFKKIPGRFSGPFSIATGAVGVAFFASIALSLGIPVISGIASAAVGVLSGVAAGFGVFSGVVLGRGISAKRRANRFLTYQKIFKDRSHISLEELQKETGYTEKQIKKDMHMIVDQKLLPISYMDEQEKYLIFSEEVFQQYLDAEAGRAERERLEAERENAAPEVKLKNQIIEEEKLFMKSLSDVRARIDTEIMQEKTDRLIQSVARLYDCVKEHPEKYSQIYRVRDYYLPTMLKLLNTYDEVEDQPIQGDNILKTKQEIEKSLDMINDAMEVMFDDIFQDIAMDTSADISVLETMLERDGWNGKKLSAEGEAPDTLKF